MTVTADFVTRTAVANGGVPDPSKHVNYTLGMVLGVDDLVQEFAYLSGRDRWLARDLIGYGTAVGLEITTDTGDGGPEVVVGAGTALTPGGYLVRVPKAQCARLNAWLDAHRADVLAHAGSGAESSITLYVVLGYRDCPTDAVPIAGEPCRTDDESVAPSRLADDFKLDLRLTPPPQEEEDALRDFVAWLSQIDLTDDPDHRTSLSDFEDLIRRAVVEPSLGSPLARLTDFLAGAPPAGLRILADDACEYLRVAFRIWTTELRPLWRPEWLMSPGGCVDGLNVAPGPEDSLLLATLHVPLIRSEPTPGTARWLVEGAPATVDIDEERRPYLLHLRMLQEWLTCGWRQNVPAHRADGEGFALQHDVTGPLNNTLVEAIRNVPVIYNNLQAGQILQYTEVAHIFGSGPSPSFVWSNVDPLHGGPSPSDAPPSPITLGGASAPGAAVEYSRGDHVHAAPDITAPTETDAVTHPPGMGPYRIVAAGITGAQSETTPPPTSYGGLYLQVVRPGLLVVRFAAYIQPTPPDDTRTYILKALLATPDPQRMQTSYPRGIILAQGQYLAEGIGLWVLQPDSQPLVENVQGLQFAIEVSEYPYKPAPPPIP
jgi:hypothetical protein